jgi:hypothetical protein
MEEETFEADELPLKSSYNLRMLMSRAEPFLKCEIAQTSSFDMNLGSMNLMKPTPSLKDKMLEQFNSPTFGQREMEEVEEYFYRSPPMT